jgi:hypothetical protein
MTVSENQAMSTLGISSWRNLSKDKFMNFLTLLPDLDKETQLCAIRQIPNIIGYIVSVNQNIIETSKDIIEKNKETTDSIIEALKEIQSCFLELLKKEELSAEERMFFADKLMDNSQLLLELDKTNKVFLKEH